MTIEQLEAKIENKKVEIAKRETLTKKLQDKLPTLTDRWDINWTQDSLRTSLYKLETLKETLANFEAQLEKAKKAKEEQDKLPMIKDIQDFLDNWVEKVVRYVKDNLCYLIEFYETSSKECEVHNCYGRGYPSEEAWKEELKSLRQQVNMLKSFVEPLTKTYAYSYRDDQGNTQYEINEKELRDFLEKEKVKRYYKLVKQIIAEVGVIKEAKNLYNGEKGDINGYIIGENGKAHIYTIRAGGYNIQCFHYRVLVKKVKE